LLDAQPTNESSLVQLDPKLQTGKRARVTDFQGLAGWETGLWQTNHRDSKTNGWQFARETGQLVKQCAVKGAGVKRAIGIQGERR
jgi:hypothetical protein